MGQVWDLKWDLLNPAFLGLCLYTEPCRMHSMRVHSDRRRPLERSRACRPLPFDVLALS